MRDDDALDGDAVAGYGGGEKDGLGFRGGVDEGGVLSEDLCGGDGVGEVGGESGRFRLSNGAWPFLNESMREREVTRWRHEGT